MDVRDYSEIAQRIVSQIETVIIGKRPVIEMTVAGFFAGGHILIEDIPGVGKTMLARALARTVDLEFKRIQFTPDLLPADILGVPVYDQSRNAFIFRPGPIFANVVLADEINRGTPKAQAALLEAMEEFQISVDGVTYPLPRPFFVIATENPIEYEGTYSLPEAQLDRFLMRLNIGYPTATDEIEILERQAVRHPIETLTPVVSGEQILQLQQAVRRVHVDGSLKAYIIALVEATRRHEAVRLGASPRGSLALMRSAQGLAALRGRDYVVPDDVKQAAAPVLAHRLILRTERRIQGQNAEEIVAEILGRVPVPLAPSRPSFTGLPRRTRSK